MQTRSLFFFFSHLLYAVLVLVLMLWLQFPVAAVRTRAESDLNRMTDGLEWKIGKIGLSFPVDVRFGDIRISRKGTKDPLLVLDAFSLRPDLLAWKKTGRWSAGYRMLASGGSISGRLELAPDHSGLRCSGRIEGLRLDGGLKHLLQKEYGRSVAGTLSGSFSARQEKGALVEMEGSIRTEKGSIGLQEPVLGMQQLAFDALSGAFAWQAGQLLVRDGRMESSLLGAEFDGSVRLARTTSLSQLQLKGMLVPRPEFMAGSGGAVLAALLKRQQGKLPFAVSGTLKAPGIVFTGLPAEFGRKAPEREGRP